MSTDASVGGSAPTTVAARSDLASAPGGTRAAEIAAYLADVRDAMTDLDPGVRDGLLDDLPEHLAEVAAADTQPLRSRLGSPAAFAAELRSAAGLAPASPATADRPKDSSVSSAELAREFAVQVDRTLGRLAGYDTLRELLVALRPGWWVVRGAGVASFLAIAGRFASYYMNVADVLGMTLLAAIGALISVRLGRATTNATAGTRMLVTIINVPCVLMVLYVALTIQRY
ncbi:MAG TPA: hypothetical protein VE132_09855 [Micromonosporaceae bacterium]|nr:hypothetical protein [Micromonosporaceae bacterium]